MRASRFFLFLAPAALLLALSILLYSAPAKADQEGNAKALIQSMADRALSILSDKTVTREQADKTFRTMLDENFDIDLLGKFALGAATWKDLTQEQKKQYLKLFEEFVVQIYNDRFRLFHGETYKIIGATAEDDRDTYVKGQVLKPNGAPPISVDWRVRNKDGKLQVIDVVVEGVSMTVTQRSEFSSVIQKNGGDFDAFLKNLQQRVAAQ